MAKIIIKYLDDNKGISCIKNTNNLCKETLRAPGMLVKNVTKLNNLKNTIYV